jgi:predicted ribosome quality control (RQC) complex YloA/Tae2 family protein
MKNIRTFRRFLSEGKKEKFPDIKKFDIDGFVVYMGRDAKSNDHLTFNIADGEDIWMHVKGVPGSHLVIRVRENLPTETTIKKVAELAKKNSKAKDKEHATVVYCQRKFVKKDPDMNDGQVKVDYVNAHDINL